MSRRHEPQPEPEGAEDLAVTGPVGLVGQGADEVWVLGGRVRTAVLVGVATAALVMAVAAVRVAEVRGAPARAVV